MKHLALIAVMSLAAVGCGASLPEDALTRIAHSLEAMRHAYLAVCEHREETAECTAIRAAVNDAIELYTRANDTVGAQ